MLSFDMSKLSTPPQAAFPAAKALEVDVDAPPEYSPNEREPPTPPLLLLIIIPPPLVDVDVPAAALLEKSR